MRALRKRHRTHHEEEPIHESLRREKRASIPGHLGAKDVMGGEPSAATIIQDSLPQPEEDQAIGGEMSRLRTLIKHHVQSYYHTAPLEPSLMSAVDANQAALADFSHGHLSPSMLTSLLLNPKTRLVTIRSCLAWAMTSRIELTCSSDTSFLPPEVVSCINSMIDVKTEDRSRLSRLREHSSRF